MSPTSCRCSTPRQEEGKRRKGRRGRGGAGGGATREGRVSQAVARPVLRQRWRGARPGSGWDRVDRRRVRSRPAPPPPPPSCMRTAHPGHCSTAAGIHSGKHDTEVGRRGPPPRPLLQGAGRKPPSPMRTASLQRLPAVHVRPLNPVVYRGAYLFKTGAICHLPVGFPLRCAQRFSRPDVATRRCCFGNNRHTSGRSSPVLSY
jgi:hypothetical protein